VSVVRIRFPSGLGRTDSEKQGKFGSDAPAVGEAQYWCVRERANGADELKSPKYFPNRIRAAWNRNKTTKADNHHRSA
jgi:hypothetical protein